MRLAPIARLLTLAAASLLIPASAAFALNRPVPTAPAAGVTVTYLPALSWSPVAGAAQYQVQVSANYAFTSIVYGAGTPITTRNKTATINVGLQHGNYYWRVRALTATGSTVSAWTTPRKFTLSWSGAALPLSPADGAAQAYPDPVVLKWQSMPTALKYKVLIATDPALSSLVTGSAIVTHATQWSVNQLLPASQKNGTQTTTYYWSVTALDSRGYAGAASPTRSFTRTWNTTTTPSVRDASGEASLYTPELSWTPVAGASGYEVEINASDVNWPSSSKVCCTDPTVATKLVPTDLLVNNRYFWRVRPLDGADNPGPWTEGAAFTKDFNTDRVQNLHMADNLTDPGTDADTGTAGYQTSVPIVQWDPVPGASAYRVTIGEWVAADSRCNYQIDWGSANVAGTAFTPLADLNLSYPPPLPTNGLNVAYGSAQQGVIGGVSDPFPPGKYCVKVEARQGMVDYTIPVFGPARSLDSGGGYAFEYVAPSAPADLDCDGQLCGNEYLGPISGASSPGMPVFTWKPVLTGGTPAAAQSYWIYVYRDAALTQLIDVALTNVPAYAPRKGGKPQILHDQEKTYDEEDTAYYWLVIPAKSADGNNAYSPDDQYPAFPQTFQKQTPRPQIAGADLHGTAVRTPTFTWSPSPDARTYRLQLSTDPSFPPTSVTRSIDTVSPTYTSLPTLPAGKWYWRVQGYDVEDRGLGWSTTADVTITLPTPVATAGQAASGDAIPTWSWSAIQGALGYEFSAVNRNNGVETWNSAVAATTPTAFTGPGTVRWQVRAVFRGATILDHVYGPWMAEKPYTKLMSAPVSLRVTRPNGGVLVSWSPKAGAYHYRVQVARDAAFLNMVETAEVEGPSFAPDMTYLPYQQGGRLYYRVAQHDESYNDGTFSTATASNLPYALAIDVRGTVTSKKWSKVTIKVTDPRGKAVGSVLLRIAGTGNRIRAARTSSRGTVTALIYVRKGGKFTVSGTRSGYTSGAYEGFAI